MARVVRAVLVGCGGMSGAWLGAAREIRGLQTVGLVDLRREAAEARAREFGLCDAVIDTNLTEVLSKTQPDMVYDCTVPEAHCEVTLTALRHGCHVLGEKPLADSMANARRVVAAAQKAGKLFAVIQNRRYQRNIRSLAAFLKKGRIGTITTVNADFYIGAHFGGFRDGMLHVLLLDMAIHTFDQARVLMDGAQADAVYCKEWNPAGSWYDHDASAMAVFEMRGGIVFNYRGSWCAEGMNTSWESHWRIVGSKGTVLWNGGDDFRCEVVAGSKGFFRAKKQLAVPTLRGKVREGGHAGIIQEFVECIRTGHKPETICTDNIKSLAMVFGAIESAESGKRVRIRI